MVLVTNSVGDFENLGDNLGELQNDSRARDSGFPSSRAFLAALTECLERGHLPPDIAPRSIFHRCVQEIRGDTVNYPIFTQTEVLLAAQNPSTIGRIGDVIQDVVAPIILGAAAVATGGAFLITGAQAIVGADEPLPIKLTEEPQLVEATAAAKTTQDNFFIVAAIIGIIAAVLAIVAG